MTEQIDMKSAKPAEAMKAAKAQMTAPLRPYYEAAKKASNEGALNLVEERIVPPYDGAGFELKKGQVIRYELIEGPQIIDVFYVAKKRPKDEWACTFLSSVFNAMTYHEGDTLFSNTPFVRPLLTVINDTVDYEPMYRDVGPTAAHSYVYPSGRCNVGMYESVFGGADYNNCDSNMLKGIYEVAGEDVARAHKIPNAFMYFQWVTFEGEPINMAYQDGAGRFKRGDYVELLAHDDLYVGLSMCPAGDQHVTSHPDEFTSYPIKVQIYEGKDGPLETAPEPERKSHKNVIDYIKEGRPGMHHGKIGDSNSVGSFDYQEKLKQK